MMELTYSWVSGLGDYDILDEVDNTASERGLAGQDQLRRTGDRCLHTTPHQYFTLAPKL